MKPVHPMPAPHPGVDPRQKGAALIVSLLLLVVMTILGLSVMRTVTLEEKMAAHTFDRSLSFQTTESALREAETYVKDNSPAPTTSTCTVATGVCGMLAAGSTERWLDSSFTEWKSATAVANGAISITPEYIIEYMGNTFPCRPGDLTAGSTCKRYRITARSNAGDDRASVVLQSIYATE